MIKLKPLYDTIRLLDISDEEYFGNKYRNYISNSRLKLINPDQEGSPELYKKGLGSSISDSLYFGSCIHQLVLQPEEFELVHYINRPTAKMGFMADILYPRGAVGGLTVEDVIEASNKIDYYKDKMDDKKITNIFETCTPYWNDRYKHESNNKDKTFVYLDEKSREKLQMCLASVEANSHIQSLLHPKGVIEEPLSMNEATLLMDIEAEVDNKTVLLHLKAKLDNFTADLEQGILTLNDLKTTGHWLSKFKEDSFVKFHYSRQLAMYLWMLRLYAEKELKMSNPSMYTNLLVVCTCPDYRAGVFSITTSEIKQGFEEFKRLLRMVAYCEVYGYDGSMAANI